MNLFFLPYNHLANIIAEAGTAGFHGKFFALMIHLSHIPVQWGGYQRVTVGMITLAHDMMYGLFAQHLSLVLVADWRDIALPLPFLLDTPG